MSFSNLFSVESRTIFKDEIKLALKEALKTPIQGYIAANEGMRIRPNRNHILSENNFQKLIIVGEKDPVLDAETAKIEAKKTNSQLIILSGGHMSHIENKEELIKVLKVFLKGC